MKNSDVHVIVIGGGPAGLFAAIAAGQMGARVILVEKGDRLGRKLLISGGGRCNVTNSRGIEHLIENTPGNGIFLHSIYSKWANQEIIQFFRDRGVMLKEEDHGRLFPVTDRASTILQALVDELKRLGVEIKLHHSVRQLVIEEGQISGIQTDQGLLPATAVVIATGGVTAKATGSSGDGYAFAEKLGHNIIHPYPTSVPIVSRDERIVSRKLQGIAVRNVNAKLLVKDKKVLANEEGDLLFTHFGLSGPLPLRLSQYLVKEKAKKPSHDFYVQIDFAPDQTVDSLKEKFRVFSNQFPKKLLKQSLKEYVPERLAEVLLQEIGLDQKTAGDWGKSDWEKLSLTIKKWKIKVEDTLGLEKAFVTGGGVELKGIEPQTLASKLTKGVYFAGEILDVHAHTGGYNITAAFSTGYIAGQNAAQYALGGGN